MAVGDLAGSSTVLSVCSASLSFDEALATIDANAVALDAEEIPLERAGRRVLAAPLLARIDAPRFDVAAMDGFAVSTRDIQTGRRSFALASTSYAGDAQRGAIAPGQAAKVTTGAILPPSGTQVLPWEFVTASENAIIVHDVPARRHVRERGSDFRAGDVLLAAGRVVDPRALVLAAAADMTAFTVWKQPRVGIIATGSELIGPGLARTTELHVPDSLSAAVELFVRQWGARPSGRMLLSDDLPAIERAAGDALALSDVLVIIGGASKGERDFAKAAVERLGVDLRFSTVAIKPGKPIWYGRVGDKHVLGLPGNPTAAMTTARLFLAPLLTGLGGRGAGAGLRWSRAPLAQSVPANGERDAFLCAAHDEDGVRLIERQSASSQMTLGLADVLVMRRANAPSLAAGAEVLIARF